MQKTFQILAALVVAGTMVMPTAAALSEFFNDETIRSPEPNAMDRGIAGPNNWWSNVFHTAADEDARLGAGMYALLHGAGADTTSDFAGTATKAAPKPYLDFVHTNFYGVIIMSDPNDAMGAVFEQRFSYPGAIAFTVLYGYYNECYEGSTAVSGSPAEASLSKGAESIDDPLWCGNPAFSAGAGNLGAGAEFGYDELVYIYKGAGGPAADVRDENNLAGTTMIYSEVIESTAIASVPVCETSPEACAARDSATDAVDDATSPVTDLLPSTHSVYDLFDQDCTASGGVDNYAGECENAPVMPLWDQRVSCGPEDDSDATSGRPARGDAEHSNGNGGPCATGDVADYPVGDAAPPMPAELNGIVLPDDNSPQQAGEQVLKLDESCYARQVTAPETNPGDTSGCQSANGLYEEQLRGADNSVPNYLDTPSRPAYRTPPAPATTPPDVTYAFADSRRGADLDAYNGGLMVNLGGSLLNGLHIVTWVGPAQDIDEQGAPIKFNEGPNGWKTAALRDVDYFSFAGEDARPLDDPAGSAVALACFLESYLVGENVCDAAGINPDDFKV